MTNLRVTGEDDCDYYFLMEESENSASATGEQPSSSCPMETVSPCVDQKY